MPKASEDLIIVMKMYDLVKWTCERVAKFPRVYRFGVGERLEARTWGILETLIRSRYTSDRLGLLNEANMGLELLRFHFRLARDLRCLSLESYGYASRAVDEVGRMVGGWIKQTSSVRKQT